MPKEGGCLPSSSSPPTGRTPENPSQPLLGTWEEAPQLLWTCDAARLPEAWGEGRQLQVFTPAAPCGNQHRGRRAG